VPSIFLGMGNTTTHCCTTRDLSETDRNGVVTFGAHGQRRAIAVERAHVGRGDRISFSPLYRESRQVRARASVQPPEVRRLAVSSCDQIRIFGLSESIDGKVRLEMLPLGTMNLNSSEKVDSETLVCAMFSDQGSSRYMVGGVNPIESTDSKDEYKEDAVSNNGSGEPPATNGAASRSRPAVLRMWDIDLGFKIIKEYVCTKANITCLAISTRGAKIFVADDAGVVCIFEKQTSKPLIEPVQLHQGAVLALEVDPHFVYTIGADKLIAIWDARWLSPQVLLEAELCGHSIKQLSGVLRPSSRWGLSQGPARGTQAPSGLLFVTALSENNHGLLTSWQLGTKVCSNCVEAHAGLINACVFGPYDNGPVLTGGTDNCIRVWDVFTLQCLKTISEHEGVIHGLAVEPQHRFYSLAADGLLKVWTLVEEQEGKGK